MVCGVVCYRHQYRIMYRNGISPLASISISLSAQQTESINSVHHDNPKSIIANEFAKFVLLFCVGARMDYNVYTHRDG